MIDAFLTPDVFTNDMAKTRAEVKRLAGKYDETDKEDDQEFRSLILDCMEPSFRREFEDLKQQDDPAILTWLKVVRSLKVVTYKQVLALQQEVQTCDIRSFPGQDVQQAFSYLSQRVRVLKSMGEYNPLDLIPFLNTLSGSVTTEANKVKWWNDISRDIVQPLEKQSTDMKMVQRLSLDEVEDRLKDQNLDFDSVQDALTDMYLSFVANKEWDAARNLSDKASPPSTFGAHQANAAFSQSSFISESQLMAYLASTGSQIICRVCSEPGHLSYDCPENESNGNSDGKPRDGQGKSSKGSSAAGNASAQSKYAWKSVPPKDGVKTKIMFGKTYKWCALCDNGKGRWTLSHDTEGHTGKPVSTSSEDGNSDRATSSANANANLLMMLEDPSAWCVRLGTSSVWDNCVSVFWDHLWLGLLLAALWPVLSHMDTVFGILSIVGAMIHHAVSTYHWTVFVSPLLWMTMFLFASLQSFVYDKDDPDCKYPRRERRHHEQYYRRERRRRRFVSALPPLRLMDSTSATPSVCARIVSSTKVFRL